MDSKTTITIDDRTFEVAADDLEVIAPLGRGAYGVVEKMRHRPSDTILAVKVKTEKGVSKDPDLTLTKKNFRINGIFCLKILFPFSCYIGFHDSNFLFVGS